MTHDPYDPSGFREAELHGRTLIPELVEKDREILRLRNALSNIESKVAARLASSDWYECIMNIIVKERIKVTND